MKTKKDILMYLNFELYFRKLIHDAFIVSNVPDFLKSEMDEREKTYKFRQDILKLAICMIERGEY